MNKEVKKYIIKMNKLEDRYTKKINLLEQEIDLYKKVENVKHKNLFTIKEEDDKYIITIMKESK